MEEKHHFTPNIPNSRPAPVREPSKKTTEQTQKRRAKKTNEPVEAVASGPFALGPAKREVKSARSGGIGGSSTTVRVKVEKLESSVGMINIGSDAESLEEESDIDFDISDPNVPCNICRSTIDDDQMKVDDQMGELVLFQVPDILNSLITSSSSVALHTSDTVTVKQEDRKHNFDCKKGRIGTLFIDEEGRMELRIVNRSFDLNRTPNSNSLQKLVLVEGKTATDLGQLSQRVICTPKIEKYQ